MIKKLPLRIVLSGFILLLLQTVYNPLQAQCTNIDFENGNLNGWQGTWSGGTCSNIFLGQCMTCLVVDPNQYTGFNLGPQNAGPIDSFKHHLMTGGFDDTLAVYGDTLPVVYPGSGHYSVCIGNTQPDLTGNGEGATMAYTFAVTPATAFFTYHYAAVLMEGGHPAGEGDYFKVQFYTDTDIAVNGNQFVSGEAADSAHGYITAENDYYRILRYHPWASVTTDLRAYVGQNVTVKFMVRGCQPAGCVGSHYAYAYLDADCPASAEIAVHHGSGCNATTATLTAPVWYGHYSWAGPGIVTDSTQPSVTINQTGHYTLTLTSIDSGLTPIVIDTFIAALGSNATANFKYTGACFGDTTRFTDFSLPHDSIATWAWDFDNNGATDNTLQNPTHVFLTLGTYPVKLTVTSSGCPAGDTTINVIVTAPPTANFTVVSPVCTGQNSNLVYTGNADSAAAYNLFTDGGTFTGRLGTGQCIAVWDTAGIKNVTLTVSEYGCTSAVATTQVNVTSGPTATFIADTGICINQRDTLVYTGTGNYNAAYSWNAPGAIIEDTGAYHAPVLLWQGSGTQQVSLQVTQNGCISNYSLNIHVSNLPEPVFSIPTNACIGGVPDTITYAGTAANLFYWNFDSAIIYSGSGAGPYVVNWNSVGAKTVSLTVSQLGCVSAPFSQQVSVNITPPTSITGPGIVCWQQQITYYDTSATDPNTIVLWSWDGGVPGAADNSIAHVTWDTAGVKNITVTASQHNCSSSATMQVAVEQCNGINDQVANAVNIYPNPAKEDFTVQINGSITSAELALYDVLGQKVYTQKIENATTGYTTQIYAPFASGVYTLKLDAGNQQLTYKVVLQ